MNSILAPRRAIPFRLTKKIKRRLLDHYYWGGKRTFYQRHIRARYRHKAMRELRRREPRLYNIIQKALAALGLNPEIPHKKHGDALFLLDFVMKERPQSILECGAGLSTLIFAHCFEVLYGSKGSAGRITSMEENKDYLETFVRPFLPTDLTHHIQFHVSPIAHDYYLDERTGIGHVGVRYTDIPYGDYELIFTDGPANRQGVKVALPDTTTMKVRGKTFSADYLNVLKSAQTPKLLLIDQRLDTRWKIMDLIRGGARERYYYAAMKYEIVGTPEHVRSLARLPITIVDPGSPSPLPLGQQPPP